MSKGRVLVTGGAGFIGGRVVRILLEDGWEVRVLDDLSMGRRENVPAEAELSVGDVRNVDVVSRAVAATEAVIHLAAVVSIRASIAQFVPDADVNLMGTLHVLKAAAESGVGRFVYASSMAVYADSVPGSRVNEGHPVDSASPYGIAKLGAERYVSVLGPQFGFAGVALRYFNTYGPGQTFTPA